MSDLAVQRSDYVLSPAMTRRRLPKDPSAGDTVKMTTTAEAKTMRVSRGQGLPAAQTQHVHHSRNAKRSRRAGSSRTGVTSRQTRELRSRQARPQG